MGKMVSLAGRVMLALLLAATVFAYLASARLVPEDSYPGNVVARQQKSLAAQGGLPSFYQSTEYKDLEEIDRLKLSINKLICDTMEDGCDQADEAEADADADQRDFADHLSESFATHNVRDHVRDI